VPKINEQSEKLIDGKMQDRGQAVHERLHKKGKKPTALGGATTTRNKDLMLGTLKSATTLHKS
jgi:hypothetical protein